MGCSESKNNLKIPLLSEINLTEINDNTDIHNNAVFFKKTYQNIHISQLRTSEEFIHDGHNILNCARILERFTISYKTLDKLEDKIRFIEIAKTNLYNQIKKNFIEYAEIYNISLVQCIIIWKDKFKKYFPELGHIFINKLKNELDIQEWNTILWDDYSKEIL